MKKHSFISALILMSSFICLQLKAQTNAGQATPSASAIFIPNVFTPNGDSRNDVFSVTGTDDRMEIEVNIFSRRGELIYSWQGLNGSWDGTSAGKPAKADIYVYVVEAKCPGNSEIKRTGTVTVMR